MKVTFITLTNSGYLDFTRNCLESLRRIGFESYLHCYCLDPRCYEELSKEHDLVHMVKDNSEVIHDLQDFRVGQWAHVTFNKFRIISENLNKYDLRLSPLAIKTKLINNINKLGPFGNYNFLPTFLIDNFKIIKHDIVGWMYSY